MKLPTRNIARARLSDAAMVALASLAKDRTVLSVGADRYHDVRELIESARRVWQVPYFADTAIGARGRTMAAAATEHMALADAGRLVMVDGDPRYVVGMLHEDGFGLAFVHHRGPFDVMANIYEALSHLTGTIAVDTAAHPVTESAARAFAADHRVRVQHAGELLILSRDSRLAGDYPTEW